MSASPATAGKAAVLGGRTGLVGRILSEIMAGAGFDIVPLGRQDFDPLDGDAAAAFLDRERPDVVLNTVAYTQVDKAEDEPHEAFRLNSILPEMWGRLTGERAIRLVHYSTDFVFDGRSDRPYRPEDPTSPSSVYGASKLAGETALRGQGLDRTLIIRTAWLFGPYKMNFVKRILELARQRDNLNVVHDQIGSPTYTKDLARYTVELVRRDAAGIFHVANAGRASWCELAGEAVHIAGLNCRIQPIPSSGYPQKAKRPAFSVLDTSAFTALTGVTPRPWAQALRSYILREPDPAREE